MRQPAVYYNEDPKYWPEGLEWIRADLNPPVRFFIRDGKKYQQPWTLASTEAADSPPGTPVGGTTDTFLILASGDDQTISKSGVAYPPATLSRDASGSTLAAERSHSGNYFVSNTLLKFDTSALVDTVTVSAATLRVYISSLYNVNTLSLTGGWYTWDGTSATDFSHAPETNAISGVPLTSLTENSTNDIALQNPTNVSKTGYTYLRLHISQLSADAAPSGLNYVYMYSIEGYGAGKPRLLVTYS